MNRNKKASCLEKTIIESEAEKFIGYLRRNAVKSVAVCVHCFENETLDEVAIMLSPFNSFPDFTWDAVRHNSVYGIDSYLVIRYAFTTEE